MPDNVLFKKYGAEIAEGETIFKEGDEGSCMYLIQEGSVAIKKKLGGKEHTLAVLQKGEFFGEMAIIHNEYRSASAVANENVKLLALDRRGLEAMIEKNAKIALNMIDRLCKRLEHSNLQLQHFARKNQETLIALNLYYLLTKTEVNEPLFPNALAETIAIETDIPAEEAIKGMQEFEKRGIISIDDGNGVRIIDKDKLLALT